MCGECDQVSKMRHSLSHIMAQAVQRVQQADVEIAIGPAIDDGFYYDFLFAEEKQIKDEDLSKIQDMCVKIIKENQPFTRIEVSNEESKYIVEELMKQQYKAELRNEFSANGETISFYLNTIPESAKDALLKDINEEYLKYYEPITQYFQEKHGDLFAGKFVTFLDMCEGPHIESTKEIDPKAFKIDRIAGAYWRGNSDNVMMTRIYAYAFENKEQLKSHLEMIEEAKARDHRKIGKDLDIFMMHDLAGKGMPIWLPNGALIRKQLENYIYEKEQKLGYTHVYSPCAGKVDLYKTSGHRDHYQENMFPVMQVEDEEFVLRPMNCPHHMLIYGNKPHSYRDLPIRIGEFAQDFRYEESGTLKGLERVRCMCQNDAHLFVTPEQIGDEFKRVVNLILDVYKDFGFKDYSFRLSLRDPKDTHKYHQDDEMWNNAENKLREVLDEIGVEYYEAIGEAAFYGPKLDVNIKPAVGNEVTVSTCQLDFCLPAKFQLTYTDKDGEKKTPVVIHRAIFGTFDRFTAFLLEETKGVFPLWLSPQQVKIIPVSDVFMDYAEKVDQMLKDHNFRSSIDTNSDSFSKKIRNAELMKIPYILIVGEKEKNSDSVSVREFKTKEQYEMPMDQFIEKIEEIRKNRSL
ncbi:threonine--tRNA ligase [bacterium]|nr:threonine--tRNA ligase [bacterium]